MPDNEIANLEGIADPIQKKPIARIIIERFRDLTGVPMVLNTSFNRRGEPIVHSPTDAVRTFRATGLDLLFLGDLAAWKPAGRWAKFIRTHAARRQRPPIPATTS